MNFFSSITQKWEKSVDEIQRLEIRAVKNKIGIV
jgi:NAD dependent epimerase/dehydratase family enzyme